MEERIVGGGVPNFFRRPFGRGWVLVGDAGYTKDPVTAQGISDAFHSAERCASALDEALSGQRPFDATMAEYHHRRDQSVLPLYELTTQLATLEPSPPEMQQLLAAIAGDQEAMDAFVSVIAGTLSPTDFFGRHALAPGVGSRRSTTPQRGRARPTDQDAQGHAVLRRPAGIRFGGTWR